MKFPLSRFLHLALGTVAPQMSRFARSALIATGLVVFPLQGWVAAQVRIPGEGDGYSITKSDRSEAAPTGYEGRTETSTQTAVGNTPATTGKRVVAQFKMGNQIRTCPQADGTAEGKGMFSLIVDSTTVQADGTGTTHIEMRTIAKYKGQVGDDGYLQGPINAEIDYTYNQTGSFRATNGTLASVPPSHVEQHITIPFTVSRDLSSPSFGAFSGGDPTKGHYAEAVGAGTALVFWAGVYYSVAQTKWMQGGCLQVAFNPPSNTLSLPPGGQATVNAEVKTKGGESVKAQFKEASALSGGSVDPQGGPSDVGSPIRFSYTAPSQGTRNPGFRVSAMSRAGAAEGEWEAGLGTGWSGQIVCTRETKGDEGQSDLQSWSNYQVMRITINVKNGVGTATGYGEEKGSSISKQKALRGGVIVLINDISTSTEGTVDGTSSAGVEVGINQADGTYSIKAGFSPMVGKVHMVNCIRDNCRESDLPFPVNPGLPGEINGQLADPNHLQGSKSDVRLNIGRAGNGTQTWTLTWDLARQASAR